MTLVQHQSQDQAHEQKQKGPKRGLRTSYTVHYVDGQFELPTECVNYILIRDKVPLIKLSFSLKMTLYFSLTKLFGKIYLILITSLFSLQQIITTIPNPAETRYEVDMI